VEEKPMIMTMAIFEESAAELDEGVRHVREEVVPAFSGAEGLEAAYWLMDRQGGKRLSVMVWRDPDTMAAAMPALMRRIRETRETAGRPQQPGPSRSERYEVFASLPE
jgi:hypothetical protein